MPIFARSVQVVSDLATFRQASGVAIDVDWLGARPVLGTVFRNLGELAPGMAAGQGLPRMDWGTRGVFSELTLPPNGANP